MIETNIPLRLDRLPWSRWHTRLSFALGITFLLDGLEGGVGGSLSGALKSASTLHFSDGQLGISSTGYLLGTVIGALVFGYLADIYGRKSVFLWTLGLYVCATAATAASWSLWTFTLCRTLTGAGIGGEYTAIASAIDEMIPARVRGTASLLIGSTFWIGVILGSLAAVGFLSDSMFGLRLGWRVALLSGIPIAIVVLFVRNSLPESPRWLLTHGRVNDAERVMSGIEVNVIKQFGRLPDVFGTVELQTSSKDTFKKIGLLFSRRYRSRAALCLLLVIAQSFFYNSVLFSSTLILMRFYGVSASHAGLLFLPIALTNVLGPVLMGKLFDSRGRRFMISITFILTGVVFSVSNVLFRLQVLGAIGQISWWAAAFFFAASSAGSAYLTTSELFPQQIRASAIAVFFGLGTLLGGVTIPAIYGQLLNQSSKLPIFWGFMASAFLMIFAGIAQGRWGVAAERRSLEEVA